MASHRMHSDLDRPSPLVLKGMDEPDPLASFDPFADDPFAGIGDLGLNFDGDGNLIETMDDELELPLLPGSNGNQLQSDTSAKQGNEPNVIIVGETEIPGARGSTTQQLLQASNNAIPSSVPETPSPPKNTVSLRKSRARKVNAMVDRTERISSAELRAWSDDYLENMDSLRAAKKTKTTGPVQARQNAAAFIYGRGVGDASVHGLPGFSHPLAEAFTGNGLQTQLFGHVIEDVDELRHKRRGRPRRTHSEAFGDE